MTEPPDHRTLIPGPVHTDTIAAISTPPGRGGIGIVRLSGPNALSVAFQILQLSTPLEHAHARRTRVLDPTDPTRILDDALVTAFLAPNSYTAENIVEIAAHGSPVILDALLRNALNHGARLATPGEFTQRAFLSGRLDLTQAEAVHDLIAAQTLDQARVAAQQLGGALSRRVAPQKESLLYLIALLEAGMDFASGELDDVDIVPPSQIAASIAAVQQPLEALAATFRRGQLLRNGASIALIGPPNAGKSSLFNRLLERERAIVTPLPGTTRDTVEESLSLAGIPLRLIDTAGLRSAAVSLQSIDLAEQQGIARSHEALADADLVLLVHDATQLLTSAEQLWADSLAGRPHLLIYNKIDLVVGQQSSRNPDAIPTSALTGAGLDDLRQAILAHLGASGSLADTASLTGPTTPDDILARIFSTFCIGK